MKHDIKRMLELAAEAAHMEIEGWSNGEYFSLPEGFIIGRTIWNPSTKDGDSRQLEVKLGLLVDVDWDSRTATAVVPDRADITRNIVHIVNIPEGSDGMAETRLAVLMAAAAMGEVMP